VRTWKPGDVVTATVNGRPNVRVIAGWSKYDPQLRWAELSTRWADGDDDEAWFMPSQVVDHRPLVVIDPEDREQVERLTSLVFEGARKRPYEGGAVEAMQAALRSLVADPKPEEPVGLGAVVEDADGRRYVRVCVGDHGGDSVAICWRGQGFVVGQTRWEDIPAVRVLSEGWSE